MGNEVIEFAEAIGAREPQPDEKKYHIFRQVFKRPNYFLLDGKLAIIKISRSKKPFWGVGKNYIDLLNHVQDYLLILLISKHEGWLFRKAEINNHIDSGKWRLREQDNNYKINPPLPDKNSFYSTKHFLKKHTSN